MIKLIATTVSLFLVACATEVSPTPEHGQRADVSVYDTPAPAPASTSTVEVDSGIESTPQPTDAAPPPVILPESTSAADASSTATDSGADVAPTLVEIVPSCCTAAGYDSRLNANLWACPGYISFSSACQGYTSDGSTYTFECPTNFIIAPNSCQIVSGTRTVTSTR